MKESRDCGMLRGLLTKIEKREYHTALIKKVDLKLRHCKVQCDIEKRVNNMFDGKYNHPEIEKKWQESWLSSQIYAWDQSAARSDTFVIDTPPPTVSGLLHMGHIFSYTQADFIARFQRMLGKSVFYPIGFDDNGLPTERLVEKTKQIKSSQLPRDEFVSICQSVVKEAENDFRALFKSIALSFDWTQEYQTISARSRKLSQMSFLDLYDKQLIYRDHAPTFWDYVDQTAIAQAEVEDKEQSGLLLDIKFEIGGGRSIAIATTRPEMLPACVAVFYHPDDHRYKNLSGQSAVVAIFGQTVPILPDIDVSIEKGTGLVMCCTFGDIQDIAWWRRHNLPTHSCISLLGKMQNAGHLDGLKIKEARNKILEELRANNLIIAQKEVTQVVKCAERSGVQLEIIPTYQWYIEVLKHREQLLQQANKCNWHPSYMKVRLENWINGLNQDWCISRQRYFGVPFPVWYSKRPGEEGKPIFAAIDQLPVDPMTDLPKGYSKDEVDAERDIMDTWATSALTPQLSSWGISDEYAIDKDRHHKLYPADLRPQAHEIIRTWAFSTIVKSYYHQNSIPWTDVMISGWCLAHDKTKMSKSKGNVVTPGALIAEKGADAVRYWASNSKLGADIIYSEDAIKNGHRLITKLWNAGKLAHMHMEKMVCTNHTANEYYDNKMITEDMDLWILSKLYEVIKIATQALCRFEYSEARAVSEDFFWKDYCDNYLEIIKQRIYDESADNNQRRISGITTLRVCMKTLLKLFAPFIPHITEELNAKLFPDTESIHLRGGWPCLNKFFYNANSIQIGSHVIGALELIRKAKSLKNISLRSPLQRVLFVSPANITESALIDLRNAATADKMICMHELLENEEALKSECGRYAVLIEVAAGL